MKKTNYIVVILIIFLFGISNVKAANYEYYCTKEAATQLAKIIYKESGANSAVNNEDNFFMKLSTAAISINNANLKSGNSFYEKIYNLTDSNYDRYSDYKDQPFENVVPFDKRNEMLYIAELVLTGKYTFPSNMTLQASKEIVENYGTVWTSVKNKDGYKDIYFGYEQGNLNSTNIYDEIVEDNSVAYYKNLASDLENTGYLSYTVNNVCSDYSTTLVNSNNNSSANNEPNVCANPEILRVVYFFIILIDIVKIIVPIGLIVFGLIDFSKAAISSDENVQKKSGQLFLKRLLYGILIFAIPWLVGVLMVTLGNVLEDNDANNFTDCIENAKPECLEALDSQNLDNIKAVCDVPANFKLEEDNSDDKDKEILSSGTCWQCNGNSNIYEWGIGGSSSACPSGWHEINKTAKECPAKKCWYCTGELDYAWSKGTPATACNGGVWAATSKKESECVSGSGSGSTISPGFNDGIATGSTPTTKD